MADGKVRRTGGKIDTTLRSSRANPSVKLESQGKTNSKNPKKGHHEAKLEKLKKVVIRILKKHPDGVLKNDIWTLVHKDTGLRVSAKDYGVSKMGIVFKKWADVMRIVGSSNAEKLYLVGEQYAGETLSLPNVLNENDFPSIVSEEVGRNREPDVQSCRPSPTSAEQNRNDVTFGFFSDSDSSNDSDDDTDDERNEIKSVIDGLIGDDENAITSQSVNGKRTPSIPSWMHIAEASKQPGISKPDPIQTIMQLPGKEQVGMTPVFSEEWRNLAMQREQVLIPGQPSREPPGLPSLIDKEPAIQRLDSSHIPVNQSGVPSPVLGNIGSPVQGVNRGYVPMPDHNQSGMMFPNFGQTRMSLLGMPLTYRIPVPAYGQFGIRASANVVNPVRNIYPVGQPPQATESSGIATIDTTHCEPSSSINSVSESSMSSTQSPVNKMTLSHVVMSNSVSMSPSPVSSPGIIQNSDQNKAAKPTPAWTQRGGESHLQHQVRMPSPVSRMSMTPISNCAGISASKQECYGGYIGMPCAGALPKNQSARPLTVVNQMTVPMPLSVPGRDPPKARSIDWNQYEIPQHHKPMGYQGLLHEHKTPLIDHNKQQQTVLNQFDSWGPVKWQPFADDVKDVAVKPIDKETFEKKVIDVRPVFVPPGRKLSSEQVDSVAKECIELLADANEFVTQERVEKLLCQRFSCCTIQELGVHHVDQITCVNDLNRLISKINAYITAFLKSRSICTLHELKEALRGYVPDNGNFSVLKTGPLQRFPVVFQQFRFPPDQAEIPEITSMDILEHFNNYLSHNRLWVNSKLELEPFMNYLVQEYDADNAYMLGVRIRSLPLAIGVLKKAKRDAAASHHAIKDHFEEDLKAEMGEAFRKFRVSILHTGDGEGMEVRTHYLKMKPEFVIMEIFDKFNVLLMVTQDRRLTKPTKFRRVIEDFLTMLREDDLGRNILHLAICMSNTAVEETVREMFTPTEDDDEENEKQICQKPPPRKDILVASLRTYIERCLNAGALSLTHLNRIEEKMLEDFEFPDFNMMGYGRFLEFLLLEETKQMLEESVGLLLGSGSGGGDSESSFKPHHMDLVEFIKQCRYHEDNQPDHVEEALCAHYNVKNVRDLGYGNTVRLLSYAEKHGKHMLEQFSVFYESALVQSFRFSPSSKLKVGILGHQTKDAAKICLHNCPLLENMADWSQWSLVFEPELGKLKDFIQKYGGITTKPLEGGKIVTLDFLALEVKPGELFKIVSSTAVENVAFALKNRDVQSVTGHLVSMVVAYKGIDNMPLALIARHIKTALIQMHAEAPRTNTAVENTAALFILQCLLRIPTKICVSIANQIFLEPLGQVIGSSKSKQVLVQLCKNETELSHLIQLGCVLGIQEWTDVIHRKCQLPDIAVQILPSEVKEFFANDQCQEEEEEYIEMSDDSDMEDVDDILAGELPVDNVKVARENSKTLDGESQDKEMKSDVSSAETTHEQRDTEDAKMEEISSCEAVVNQIRRDEFGVGVQLSEDGQRLMKVQQERLGRSLDRLSKDLYSKDTHFVLELVQNADDNSYSDHLLNDSADECPSVKFVIDHDGIYVLNNEQGFREKDIKALCDVGRSTKGKHKFGYIGQKGIGFKSVFRITDAPEVHSNGYHIRFDVKSGPMGYILPHWVPEEQRISQDKWMTHIILRLKADMRLQTRTLAARFNDIHPSLLLFLHRLRQITVENKVENSVQTMQRRDIGDNVVEIQHTHGRDKWLVVKKTLDASQISIQTKSGADVESTEIALAFPLNHQDKKSIVQRMPPKQPVFAFLPLRSYGFRFIIQGDFDVPSSREDVDRDSSWNQWLRNEIHNVFVDCLDIFKTHPEFSSMEAVCAFLQFVPMEDEVLEFFKPVASDILKKMKAKPCVPTQQNAEGTISWKMPCQTVMVRDPLVRSVVTEDLLEEHLNLFYLHSDVAAMLNPALTSSLGIETLTSDHLFQLGKALVVNMGTHCSKEEDVYLISKWMACLYRSLDEFHQDDTILATLKSHRVFPLSDGELVKLQDKTVFYPINNANTNRHTGKDPLYYLQQDVKSLHPMLLNTGDDEVNSQVQKLLQRLGIKQLSPFDVINHHILPVLKSDLWKTKQPETLISYLVYVKGQIEKQASVCNLDEFKDVAMVMTNKGFKNPSMEPVHFPPQYGNQIHLKELFSGYDWTLVDPCYLPNSCTLPVVSSWQNFFRKLGVEDFLTFRKKDVHIRRGELDQSLWRSQSVLWPDEEQEFIVQDYYSAEIEGLITNNRCGSDHVFADQMGHLFTYLDRHWDSRFSKYCNCQVLDKDGNKLKETDASFSILLRTSDWLPAVETMTTIDEMGFLKRDKHIVIKQPSGLYIKSDILKGILCDKVLYLNAKATGGSFCQFLGIRNTVDVKTVKDLLLQWSERKDQDSPAVFCTTLEHMKRVYRYLCSQLTRQDFQNLLQEEPVFFVPDKTAENIVTAGEIVIPAKMLNRNEIWLVDRTGLFAKHRRVLEEFHSEICNKRTIAEFYNDSIDIIEVFKQEAKLDVHPKVDEYIKLLCLLCSTSSPNKADVINDVLCIFSTIGEILVTPPVGLPDGYAANNALQELKAFVKRKLKRQKVFPTNKQVWVSLEDDPMIPDNKEWEKLFIDKPGVHFLDMEDRTNRTSRTTRGGTLKRELRNKVPDFHIRPEMISVVVEVCSIKKLSECVDIRPTPEIISSCPQMQMYFSQIVPAIQQYLIAKFDDVNQSLEQMNISKMLTDGKFYQAHKLEVSYWLPNLSKDTFVIQQEKCIIHPPEFYFHREHLTNFKHIIREIARFFSKGNTDCNNLLRSFLSELSDIICEVSEEPIEGLLQRYDADGIDIPEEDKWKVEAPVVTEKEKPDEKEADKTPAEDITSEKTGQEKEGPFEIRSWPPVANPNRTQSRAASEVPASNIWPPPEGKEYMRSVKDLPANIRMVMPDKDSEGNLQKPGTGDNINSTDMVTTMVDVPRQPDLKQNKGIFTEQVGSREPRSAAGLQNGHIGNGSAGGQCSDDSGQANGAFGIRNLETRSEQTAVQQISETDQVTNSQETHSGKTEKSADPVRENTNSDAGDQNGLVNGGNGQQQNSAHTVGFAEGNEYQERDHQNLGRRQHFITGDPFWSSMATEYTYDDLGSGKDICAINKMTFNEGAGDYGVGKWGEALVAQYLQRQKELGNIHNYSWKNKEEETGCPFDFEIQLKGDDGVHKNYIEVKSTVTENKEVFEISVQQVKLANQMKSNFHIYRVFNAGNPERVKLIRISNLDMRLSTKQVKLCMLI